MGEQYEQLNFYNAISDGKRSFLQKYQDLVLGNRNLWALLYYEFVTLLCNQLPGALGLALRRIFYPRFFAQVGKGALFGHHLTLRSPRRVAVGSHVLIDDYVMISVRGSGDEQVRIGDGVQLGRYTQLKNRAGSTFIGNYANIGAECRIDSTSQVHIGEYCLIAGRCYIGGVNHGIDRLDIPIVKQPPVSKGGVHIGRDVWLGANVIVLDGVTIGEGAVIGAGAVVTKDIPPYAIATGVPAKVKSWRKSPDSQDAQPEEASISTLL
jgi:acetyltransferase-like isoleucine patch superfamily enzyme